MTHNKGCCLSNCSDTAAKLQGLPNTIESLLEAIGIDMFQKIPDKFRNNISQLEAREMTDICKSNTITEVSASLCGLQDILRSLFTFAINCALLLQLLQAHTTCDRWLLYISCTDALLLGDQ